MAAGIPPGRDGAPSPAEREARWDLSARFAIEAAGAAEAAAILAGVLAMLTPELPLRGEPVIRPRHRTIADGIWVADLTPGLTGLQEIHPDDARNRRRFAQGSLPAGVCWSLPQDSELEATCEWPPGIWQRQPGRDDMLLHPAVRAVTIACGRDSADPGHLRSPGRRHEGPAGRREITAKGGARPALRRLIGDQQDNSKRHPTPRPALTHSLLRGSGPDRAGPGRFGLVRPGPMCGSQGGGGKV